MIDNQEKSPAPKEIVFKFRMTKRRFIISSIVLISVLALVYLYSAGFFELWWRNFHQASLTTTVKDIETGQPIAEAIFQIDKITTESDKNGRIHLENLFAGSKKISISQSAYQNYQTTVLLRRGKNQLPDTVLTLLPLEKFSFSVVVKDKISDLPLPETVLNLDSNSAKTDDQGRAVFKEIVTGKYLLTITKEGYKTIKKEFSLDKNLTRTVNFVLLPNRLVYFLSNRDGKVGVYSSDLAGQEQVRVVPKSEKGEELRLLIAPDYKSAYFTSYRDGEKDEDGNKIYYGYILDLVTNKFSRITAERNPNSEIWSDDGRFLIYRANKLESGKNYTMLNIFDLKNNTTANLWQSVDGWINSLVLVGFSHLLFSADRGYKEGDEVSSGLLLIKLDGTDKKQILLDHVYNFSNDRKEDRVYFSVSRDNLKYSFDSEKLELKEIKDLPDNFHDYLFSPNGRQIIYNETRDGKSDIYLQPSQGGDEKRLTTSGTAQSPQWLDSDLIVYVESRTGETALYVISTQGGQPQKITDVTLSGSYR